MPKLLGVDLEAADDLAVADYSASETRRLTAKDLIQNGVQLIDDGTIPGAKLVTDSITALQIAPDAVTDSELADDSVDTAAIQDAAVINDKVALDTLTGDRLVDSAITARELGDDSVDTAAIINLAVTNDKIADGVDGGKLIDDTVTASKIPASSLDRGLDKTSGSIGHTNSIGAQTMSGISFDDQGHINGATRLIDTDLPPATETKIGAISVPLDSGLIVSTSGVIDHSLNVTAGTMSGIDFDEHGHIASARPLVGTDLPPATNVDLGAVTVPGPVLEVDGTGSLIHGDTPVAPGIHAKVEVDQQGHVIAGLPLSAGDIPALDATILTTGFLNPARIEDLSVKREKLADYAISYIQEATPDVLAVHPIGCLWYQESSAQLRMWNGNSFMPVGFGRLSEENLRFCGTADAAAGTVIDITTFGSAAGMQPATAIPAATDALTGAYLVVKTPGTYGGDVYDNGDWILCIGQAGGWVRVDTLTGTGTTTIKIEDLLDVNITTAQAGDTLIFDPITSKWINRSTSARKATFVEAFDGVRTSFTMNVSASNANDIIMSIGGVIQEPGADFTFTAPRAINFSSAPSVGLEYFILIEGVAATGGGGGGTTLPPGTAAYEYLQWDNALAAWTPSTTLDGGSF